MTGFLGFFGTKAASFVGVRLQGGIGNQMFQYAAARALAERCSAEVIADLSAYEKDPLRTYLLDRFRARVRPAAPDELKRLKVHHEKSFSFDPLFTRLRGGTLLDGYWQAEKYFLGIRTRLLEELKVKSPDPANNALEREIKSGPSVSLHVRRGDYASDPATNRYHGLCGEAYYKEAVRRVAEKAPAAKFYLFSDDAAWTRAHVLPLVPQGAVVGTGREEEDLRLMSACSYHVIANSSFSWWGAWLSESPGKIVFAPQKWFAGAGLDTADLIPDSWRQI